MQGPAAQQAKGMSFEAPVSRGTLEPEPSRLSVRRATRTLRRFVPFHEERVMTLSLSIAPDPRIVQHGELLRRRLPAAAVAQLQQVARAFAWRLDQRMAVPGWKARLLDELGLACTRARPGLHQRQGGLLLQIVDHDQGRLREWPPR
jgi:hypothetical protein